MSLPRTLGELRRSPFPEEKLRTRRVKQELRDNLIARLQASGDKTIFPGIVGYEVAALPTGTTSRTGTIAVAGLTFTVRQTGK